MSTIVNLICGECNKSFTVKKGRETKFCSEECKKNNRYNLDLKYYIEKSCECCGVSFKSKIKENKRFCSYKCSGQNKKDISRENKICLNCGTEFNERIKRVKNFCSDKCIKEWQLKPENIKLRLEKTENVILKKYGVKHTFQVDKIRLKAIATHKSNGYNNEDALLKLEEKRRKKLSIRFLELGYNILEFKNENIIVQHPDGHIFEDNRKLIVNRLNHEVELSTIIQPIGSPRTTFERKICKLLDENNIKYIPNTRRIIEGELDIYIPSFNLAIEINGLHWHSEYYIDKEYHLNKTKKCNGLNIQLLHFFEDELFEKYPIIESIIKNKILLNNTRIFARKCVIKEIDAKISKEFLNNNHIQGNVNSSIKLGLFNDNELVSLMTFGKLRNVMGNKNKIDGEYEMLRFCNKLNTIVIGGASKLYSYFKKTYKPISVTSFANKRYSNGNLYNNLGFKLEYETLPNYWYVIGKTRKHRFLFRKDILVSEGYDPRKTEHEIMLERKIPRIYDCGNFKFINKTFL